jgi:hypothetical protein
MLEFLRQAQPLLGKVDFQVRNLLLSAPIPGYGRNPELTKLSPEEYGAAVAALRDDGIAVLPGFASPDVVARLRGKVDDVFANPRRELDMRSYEESGYFQAQILEPLLLGEEAAQLAFHPDLLAIADRHLGRRAKLVDCDFGRTAPMSMDQLRSANEKIREGLTNVSWHYDNRGRQVKAMFYLTDVGPDGQNFAYCAGTHRGIKSNEHRFSRFSDAWVEQNVRDVREAYAQAGSAVIFDTRGIHRLRRKPTTSRDAITFYYHAGYLQKFPPRIARRIYATLPEYLRENLIPVD